MEKLELDAALQRDVELWAEQYENACTEEEQELIDFDAHELARRLYLATQRPIIYDGAVITARPSSDM